MLKRPQQFTSGYWLSHGQYSEQALTAGSSLLKAVSIDAAFEPFNHYIIWTQSIDIWKMENIYDDCRSWQSFSTTIHSGHKNGRKMKTNQMKSTEVFIWVFAVKPIYKCKKISYISVSMEQPQCLFACIFHSNTWTEKPLLFMNKHVWNVLIFVCMVSNCSHRSSYFNVFVQSTWKIYWKMDGKLVVALFYNIYSRILHSFRM